jgi:hypothetical protein
MSTIPSPLVVSQMIPKVKIFRLRTFSYYWKRFYLQPYVHQTAVRKYIYPILYKKKTGEYIYPLLYKKNSHQTAVRKVDPIYMSKKMRWRLRKRW